MKIPKKVLRSMNTLIQYSIASEEKHFEESGKPRNHIFRDVRKIAFWLKNIKK
jgi:hypothetical protein